MKKYFIITGSPVSGFRYIGPFESGSDAVEYRHDHDDCYYWWIAELLAPEKE